MEGVALKFKRLGCSFLESIDIESDSGCVNGITMIKSNSNLFNVNQRFIYSTYSRKENPTVLVS